MADTNILTLTPQNNTEKIISDGRSGSRVQVKVERGGQLVMNETVTDATLVQVGDDDYHGSVDISGGSTDVLGLITVTPVTTETDTVDLELYVTDDYGTLTLKTTILLPVTVGIKPSLVSEPVPAVTLTAEVKTQDGQDVDGMTLTWGAREDSFWKFFKDGKPIVKTADPADSSSYQSGIGPVTQEDLDSLDGASILVSLTVSTPTGGDSNFGMVTNVDVPTAPPLKAPVVALPYHPHVLDDNIFSACQKTGIPFRIPDLANARFEGRSFTLSGRHGTDVYPMNMQLVTDVGEPFLVYVLVENPAFNVNGPLEVYYEIYDPITDELTASEVLVVRVTRSHPVGIDGPVSEGLTDVQVDNPVYAKHDFDNEKPLVVTLDFNGDTKPLVGDTVQPVIVLTGFTLANLNWVKRLTLPLYVLTAKDIEPGARLRFPDPDNGRPDGFTYNLFAGVDGSNGDVFFVYRPGGGNTSSVRSPSRSVIVDVMPAYSGGGDKAKLLKRLGHR